ncbi:MAG: type IV secretory system conjugative DNA transfer family protein [Caulobacteraceae bacterium]
MAKTSKPLPQDRRFGPNAGALDTSKSKAGRLAAWLLAGGSVAGFWAATEVFAWRSEFSPLLGASLSHIYAPWSILQWAKEYGADHTRSLNLAFMSGILTAGLPVLGLGMSKMNARNKMRINPDLHGSARWADMDDLQENGLIRGNDGVVIGGYYDPKTRTLMELRHHGPEHILSVAPSRSGKGVGLILPTLLSWEPSVVISDLKGELYKLTSGWRGSRCNNTILKFDPSSDGDTLRWNLLEEVRVGTPFETADAQNVSQMIVDPDGKGLTDHWAKTANALVGGALLHLIYRAGHQYTVPKSKSDGSFVLKMDENGQLIPKRQRDEGGNLIPVYTQSGAEQAEEFVTGARYQLVYESGRLAGLSVHATNSHGGPIYALGEDDKPILMRDARGEVLIDRIVGPTPVRFHERDGRKSYTPLDLEGRPVLNLCRPGTSNLETEQDIQNDRTVYKLRKGVDGKLLLDVHGNVQFVFDDNKGPGYGYPLFKLEYYDCEEADGRRDFIRDAETHEPILADNFRPFAPLEPITRPRFRNFTDRQGNDLYETETETRTAGVANMWALGTLLADPERPNIQDLWHEMMTFDHYGPHHPLYGRGVGPNRCTNPTIAQAAKDMFDRPEEEAGSVLSTAKSNLDLYRDPIVARNTARSDFKITDLMRSEKPVSLYVIFHVTDKDRMRPLIRIMFSMMTRILAPPIEFHNGAPTAEYRHKLLFLIDEFPALGRMPMIEETLAYAAGYGLKYFLVTQDLSQLRSADKGYEPEEKITSGCKVQNAYTPDKYETAEYFSKLCGETTIIEERISVSTSPGLGGTRQRTRSLEATGRPLLRADEFMAMPGPVRSADGKDIISGGKMLIKPGTGPMIMGKQFLYFQDEEYLKWSKVPIMPVYPMVRIRFNSFNPNYKSGAIAENGIFLRYTATGEIIRSVHQNMDVDPARLKVETIADDQLDQVGLAAHEAGRLTFRRHTFEESIVRPKPSYEGMNEAEAARVYVEDQRLRAREPRKIVKRTVLLVYQDGNLLNGHHLPEWIAPPEVADDQPVELAPPSGMSQDYNKRWRPPEAPSEDVAA